MLPDLDTLTLYLRALELGSLSKAAARMHLVVSAASRRLAIMEQQLGVPLLVRSSTGVQPTIAGRALAEHARVVLGAVDRMRSDMADFAGGARGHVRVFANNAVMGQELPALLAQFTDRFRDVKLEVKEGRSQAIGAAVLEGRADLGFLFVGEPLPGLRYHHFRVDRLVALVARRHPAAAISSTFTQLLDHDHIALDDTPVLMRLFEAEATLAGKPLRLRARLQSYQALCGMVAAGHGVGVLPDGVVRRYASALDVRLIELEDAWASRDMMLCVRDNDHSAGVAKLLGFVLSQA